MNCKQTSPSIVTGMHGTELPSKSSDKMSVKTSNLCLRHFSDISRKEFKGQKHMGQQNREPLRGKSASERVSEREGSQRISECFSSRRALHGLRALVSRSLGRVGSDHEQQMYVCLLQVKGRGSRPQPPDFELTERKKTVNGEIVL